jgi:hypothetical protein
MNWVLENLVQRALNGLEDILLKFQSQISCDNFYKKKNHPIFGRIISLVTPSLKLHILKKMPW